MRYPLSVLFFLMFGLFACQDKKNANDPDDGLAAFHVDSLAKDIQILASDTFLGRKPFTEGETKTINYIKNRFQQLGLEPGNGTSYFQEVPMVNIVAQADSVMRVNSGKDSILLKGFDDYVIWTDKTDSVITLQNTPVVFAGYGVVAPEYNWNDYAGIDVKGKVVMVLVNDPGYNSGDRSLFKGDTMTYYGRWTYKFEEAARQGARGCLIVHNTKAASYPFSVVQNNWNSARLHLDNRNKEVPLCDVIGWISESTAKKLLKLADKTDSLLAGADKPGFKSQPLDLSITTGMRVQATYNTSQNVIGKITGTDKAHEYIIYSAHWDHLGIGTADETGDSIYNGALDNASATAGLFEIARAFKSLKSKPSRSIIFLSVTAEEQGLWGSAWYAENPIYPPEVTVANINMDGINPFEKTNDIIIIGQGQSELEDYLTEEAKKAGRYTAFETHPEAGYYYRSDHFNFAKIGIPSLYTARGIDVAGKGKEYGQKLDDEYREKHYHRPSDEFDPETWKLGGIEDLKLLFQVGKRLANQENRPQWKAGSEFKSIRNK